MAPAPMMPIRMSKLSRALALRALGQGDRSGEDLAVPEVDHACRLARAPAPERGHEVLEAADAALVDADDHVAGAEPAPRGPAVGHDAADAQPLAALAVSRYAEEGAARGPRAGRLARAAARGGRHLDIDRARGGRQARHRAHAHGGDVRHA